ncbi:NADP-dependent oxidoreductase [Ktedonosporobacter rubrisoli]|uniref:NADP-dependent oxidoreductase n=1 Tax=Ktedonosporobacter rubrisoli TaxID=2509675 RepID=A0A4P6JNX0_KTERU|nr:NADP-dependent oxidoreductase [Ktedonosporobacter rubrisoli]QBD77004.1 NADP-dependent oxidoreductase [Ktedonosporobacter rubrisoli]
MSKKNIQVLLVRRPQGWVQESDFRLVETELPALRNGEVLVKHLYLSLDPYMRGTMNDAKSYQAKVELEQVMRGGIVGVVEASRHPNFQENDLVSGYLGWQQYSISTGQDALGRNIRKLHPKAGIAPSLYLGVLGMPGVTAWIGLVSISQPKAGETLVVSAASGAVGSVAGQLARIRGCRVVGIAGGKAKCDYVVNELGFDACVDYKAGHLAEDLARATPVGIDIDFENVGGEVLEAVALRLNPLARIALCGLVSEYNEIAPQGFRNFGALLTWRIKLQGFNVGDPDSLKLWPQAQSELEQLILAKKLTYRESIVNGIEQAPGAFIGMLKGENFGKQLVKLT